MKTYMMEIKELKFSYGFKKPDIFSDFSLTLQPGAVYGLLGKNGTGKSTLLYLMCGLLRPKSGSVTFCGSEMSRRQPTALQEIYIVPEEFTLHPRPIREIQRAVLSAFLQRDSQQLSA